MAANTLSAPRGLAYDSAGQRLFVADNVNSRVLVYDVASISNGEDATGVLGQAGFISDGSGFTQATLSGPSGLAYDGSSRLFVADTDNNRVMVYDVSTVSNGENAANVLGQADFTSNSSATTQAGLYTPWGLAYASTGSRLFVADNGNHRIVVYNLADGLANGENAVAVLGQANLTSGTANRGATAAANTLSQPRGVAHDASSSRLFVADTGNHRALVYDAETVTTGEDAAAVLGQATFTATVANRGGAIAANGLDLPSGAAYNSSAEILYLADTDNNRVLLFNASGPTGTALSINGGATYATSITATLALTATGAAQMLVSDSASFTGATYQTYTTTLPWGLSTGDGAKAVYARFRDSVMGASSAVSDTILLDTTPPVTFTLASPATGAFTNTATPTFTWEASSDATSGLAKYQLLIDGALNRDNVLTSTISITPTGALTEGLHTWNMVAVDNAGNARASSSTNSLTVDTTPPVTFTLSSPITGTITNTGTITFTWEASSDATSGLTKYQLYIDGALNRDNIITTTLSITATGVLTDGLHTWMVAAVDNAGNTRESSTNSFTLDTVAPSLSGVGASGVTTNTATITWATSEAASSQVEYGLTDAYGSATTEADTSTRVVSHTVVLSGLTPETTYHYRAKSRDEAGNLGVSSDGTFTTTTTAVLLYLPMLAKASSGGW